MQQMHCLDFKRIIKHEICAKQLPTQSLGLRVPFCNLSSCCPKRGLGPMMISGFRIGLGPGPIQMYLELLLKNECSIDLGFGLV